VGGFGGGWDNGTGRPRFLNCFVLSKAGNGGPKSVSERARREMERTGGARERKRKARQGTKRESFNHNNDEF
jgi:hypothetical protein